MTATATADAAQPAEVDVTALGPDEIRRMVIEERAAVKEALRKGEPKPETPATDWMTSADYANRKTEPKAKSSGSRQGGGLKMTDEQLTDEFRKIVEEGVLKRTVVMKTLRDRGMGASHARAFPIIDRLIEEAKARGVKPAKPTSSSSGSKSSGTSKAKPEAEKTMTEVGKEAEAAKSADQRRQAKLTMEKDDADPEKPWAVKDRAGKVKNRFKTRDQAREYVRAS